MSTAVLNVAAPRRPLAAPALKAAAAFWFLVAAAGQLVFVWYIVAHYAGPTLSGAFESWNTRDLIKGYVPGDTVGNLAFAAHVLVAGLITASGLVQLVPQVRAWAPRLHRWNGRFYIAMAVLMALEGLWMVWGRGTYLNLAGAWGISLLAGLTLLASAMTLRLAMARRFDQHRQWALRTFLLVNAVWFQRIGYMGWVILNGRPVGITSRMDGWFDIGWGFGSYIVPLAVLQLYLMAQRSPAAAPKFAVAGLLTACALLTGLGSVGAYLLMWKDYL